MEPQYPILSSGFARLFNGASDREKMKVYYQKVVDYNKYSKDYKLQMRLYEKDKLKFIQAKRIENIKCLIGKSSNFSQNVDYKKGLSHNMFYERLKNKFSSEIYESLSVLISYKPDYYFDRLYPEEIESLYETKSMTDEDVENALIGRTAGRYITDFTLIRDGLKIAIEIDEPYSLKTKQPYHIDDQKRNKFFLNNNWIVIRFCEEQILFDAHHCCSLIDSVADGILQGDICRVKRIYSEFPRIKKWDEKNINDLIKGNYREKYIKLRKDIDIATAEAEDSAL